MVTPKGLSQFNGMVLDNVCLRRTKLLTLHELCGKRRSLSKQFRLQTSEITSLLLQTGSIGKLVTVPRKVTSLDDLKSQEGIEEMDGEKLYRTVIQQSVLDAFRLKTLLNGKTYTMMSVTRHVGFKA